MLEKEIRVLFYRGQFLLVLDLILCEVENLVLDLILFV
jgi:hypothetical protein